MFVKWLVVLPMLVALDKVTLQPVTIEDKGSRARLLDSSECCPCPGNANGGVTPDDYPCRARSDDAEASASILLPALRAIQPYVKHADQKTEPRPLLQPEVGLASSVLETLRQATDEEYLDAVARDAARSAVNIIESSLDSPLSSSYAGPPSKKVRIYLNTKGDVMDDNLPEPSHIQETRCIHSPLKSIHKKTPLRLSRPTPIIEFIELAPESKRKLKNKNILHRNLFDMDNGIDATNVQERVIEPNLNHNLENLNLKTNPALLNLFGNNNLKWTNDDSKENDNSRNQKFKPQIHLKLRELLDNLEVGSEKSKVPVINLRKYIATTTRVPPLQVKSTEKPIYNKKPLFLKDLLKLKDVELIPQNILFNDATTEKSSYANIALQPQNSKKQNFNLNIDNCKKDNHNILTKNNSNVPIRSDIKDAEISPTISNPIFEIIPNEIYSNKQNVIPNECMAEAVNVRDLEDRDNYDFRDIKIDQDSNKKQILSDNCNEPVGDSYMQQLPSNENQSPYSNEISKGRQQKLEGGKDLLNEQTHNDAFPIELLEDFDTPIEFDNNSFIPETDLNGNDIAKNIIPSDGKHKSLIDTIAETSNDDLQIREIDSEKNRISEVHLNKLVSDCNSTFVSNDQMPLMQNEGIDSLQQKSFIDDMKISSHNERGTLSNINENLNSITLNDLQNMSNSILTLSECEPLYEENVNMKSNLNQMIDDCDLPITLSTPAFEKYSEENFEETENTQGMKESANNNVNKVLNMNSSENVCELSRNDELPFNINEAEMRKSEMRAEASEPESTTMTKLKSYNPTIPLIRKIVENDKKINIFTKAANDIKVNKHSDFLNNLKSKFEGLFSTTEKGITSDVSNSSSDNVHESSNMNSLVTMPQTILRDSSPAEINIKSYKNKLHIPKYVEEPYKSNSFNLLKFPLDESTPFDDIFNPSLSFSDLSDRLRSHTENTIQNVKETLESTLRDSQKNGFSRPIDGIDSHDILEGLSNRRDEMKDKLEAIHLDLNDRLSSFQQSILDHVNLKSRGSLELQESSTNGGLTTKYIPLKHELPLLEASKYRNLKDDGFWPGPMNGPKNKQKHSSASKISIAPDLELNNNSNRNPSFRPVLTSTSTAIPSFIPRPKVLKTSIDSTPILSGSTSPKLRSSQILNLPEVTKRKPLILDGLLNSSQTKKLSIDPYSSPNFSPRINLPVNILKPNAEEIDKNLSKNYSLNKLSKSSLQRNQNEKARSEFTKNSQSLVSRNSKGNELQSISKNESLLSRIKEGRPRIGSKSNDELIISPTSHVDTTINASQNDGLRLVEPMKENVPYKCKLICYKD